MGEVAVGRPLMSQDHVKTSQEKSIYNKREGKYIHGVIYIYVSC